MTVFNFQGDVKKSQFITEHSSGTQFNSSGVGEDQIAKLMKEVNGLLENGCTTEQNQAGRQVIQELSESVVTGNVSAHDEETWITKLKKALAIGANVATITQEPYWSKLEEAFHRFFSMLSR